MPNEQAVVLHVTGMTCNNCVNHVQKALSGAPGVASAIVNLKKGTAEVRGDALSVDRLTAAVRDVGYDVKTSPDSESESRWKFWRR